MAVALPDVRESAISMPYLTALKNVLKQAVPNVRFWRLNQALRLPAGTCESSPLAGGAPVILVQLLPLKVFVTHGSPGPRYEMIIKTSNSSSNNYMCLCIEC